MSKLKLLHKICELPEEKLTTKVMNNKLLLGTKIEGKSTWKLAANGVNIEVLHNIWERVGDK